MTNHIPSRKAAEALKRNERDGPAARHARDQGEATVPDEPDEELERQRLEPGLNADGTGGAGANPSAPHAGGNNT